MRVIGGNLKGKFIHNPIDKKTRPLKDMVRESIFNILEHSHNEKIHFRNQIILDLFSGSGSFGIECLSRGAKKIYFVENYKNTMNILKKNLGALDLKNTSEILLSLYFLKDAPKSKFFPTTCSIEVIIVFSY